MQFSIFIFFQFFFDIIGTSKNYHKRKPNYRAVILKRYQINQIGSLSKNLQVTKETKRTFDIRGLYSTKRLLYSALNSRFTKSNICWSFVFTVGKARVVQRTLFERILVARSLLSFIAFFYILQRYAAPRARYYFKHLMQLLERSLFM